MILKDNSLQFYIDKLKNNEHFSLGMLGDGEWQCIFNKVFNDRFSGNCEGTLYPEKLSSEMFESLKFKSSNFYFAAPDTFKKVKEYYSYEEKVDKLLTESNLEIEFHEKNVWNTAMCNAELYPLIQQLRKMNVVIISNKALRKLNFLRYDKFIEISYPNCYLDGSLDKAYEEALKYGKPGVYILACGIPAILLAQKLHNKIKDSWFIDMGSIWDTFVGIGAQRPTREFLYSHPKEYEDWKYKNLKETIAIDEDRSKTEYWNERVKSHKNEKRMIWYGQEYKFDTMDRVARNILSMFSDCTALELCCGYGRMCDVFKPDKYLGIDFSEEMIKLAHKKYSKYNFSVADIKTFEPDKKYDVIFEVMSPDISRFEKYARVALVNIHPSTTTIIFKNLS